MKFREKIRKKNNSGKATWPWGLGCLFIQGGGKGENIIIFINNVNIIINIIIDINRNIISAPITHRKPKGNQVNRAVIWILGEFQEQPGLRIPAKLSSQIVFSKK